MLQKLAIFVIGAIVGGVAVGWYCLTLESDWAERELFIQPGAEVSKSVMVLGRLHAGDKETAIELLEQSLDGGLVGLSIYSSNEFPLAKHHLIQGALHQAREYRSRYPRTNDNPVVEAAISKALDNKY